MCATSVTCGNPVSILPQINEVFEAKMKKESAAAARLSSILGEEEAAPMRKRTAAREGTAPVKAAA